MRFNHWHVVFTVCIGAFMAALDASIVNIALPRLQAEFHVGMDRIEWVSLVYLLTLASSIVLFGRLADMKGRSWMYTSGFIVFAGSSLLCGIAPTFAVLIVARILQAVGAAMLQANSVSIITAVTPQKSRGRAIGIQASAQGIGLTFGPAIGGALLTYFNWRWLFLVNVPIGILGTILAFLILPRDKKKSIKESFDFLGAFLLALSLISLTYVLNQATQFSEHSYILWGLSLLTILGITLFVRTERKAAYPIVELSLFHNKAFSTGNFTGALSFTVMYAVLFLAPYMMEHLFLWSTFFSGLMLTFIPLGMTLITPFSGWIADRTGAKLPTIIGMAATAFGCLLLYFTDSGSGLHRLLLMIALFTVGLGMGLFTPPNNSGVMGAIDKSRLGIAGGILNMSRTVGMNFGIAVGGLSFRFLQNALPTQKYTYGLNQAFHDAFLLFALIALANTAILLFPKKTGAITERLSANR